MAYDTASKKLTLFVGTYTQPMAHVLNAKGEGIYVFNASLDSDQAPTITHVATIGNIVSPSFLDFTNSKKFLYAISENDSPDETKIHGFKISNDQNGFRYQHLETLSIGGHVTSHIQVDREDRFAFVSNYGSGSVVVYKLDPNNGKMEKINFYQFTEHSNVLQSRQEAPHLHMALLDKKMRFVYFADLGNDCVYRFTYSSTTGIDNQTVTKFPSPPGCGPRHMAFDPINEKYLYVSCELSNHLLAYKVDEAGSLEQIQYIPTTETYRDYKGANASSDIHMSPDGRFVYIATRFIDILSVFQVQPDGKVQLVQEMKTGGEVPRNFLLYNPRNLVLVGNQKTHTIVVFQRNVDTGKLTQLTTWSVNTPACLKILEF